MTTDLARHIQETPLVDTRDPGAARNPQRIGGGDRRRCPGRAPAMAIATRIMRDNQYACFDVEGTRANVRGTAGAPAAARG